MGGFHLLYHMPNASLNNYNKNYLNGQHYLMNRDDLRNWVKDEVTMSGSIQLNITDKEIDRVIDYATQEVYEMYPDALKDSCCIIPLATFRTPEFKRTRTIQFPKCVMSVTEFREMKRRNSLFGIQDPDISFNRAFQSDMYFSAPYNMDTVTFRTMQWSLWDQLKMFTLVDIQHSWNRNSHTLLVPGHDPFTDVWCRLMVKVPEQELWEDPWCKKWIAAKCKKQVHKLLGTVTANIIGGVTINANIYKEDADADIQECKDYWKELIQGDYFLAFP